MKKVVKGKMYNTDTATLLGIYTYMHPGDFRYEYEEMYRKKNGEFFMVCEGGPASRYSISEGNTTYGTVNNFFPITDDEARKWIEKNLDVDMYIALFGEPEE